MKTRSLLVFVLSIAFVAAACDSGSGSGSKADASSNASVAKGCDWPMFGQNLSRTFDYPCKTGISPSTVGTLTQQWFFNTNDVVTATPAVFDGTVYVGDWSGIFYAIDQETGKKAVKLLKESGLKVQAR